MTDQCKHCTLRGDIKACESVPCFQRENWWAVEKMQEMKQLKKELRDSKAIIENSLQFINTTKAVKT
jgi:hypothetical protein